jgi:hypothetical protein
MANPAKMGASSKALFGGFSMKQFNLHGTGLLPNAIFSARGWSPNHIKVFNRIIFVFPLKYVTGVKNDVGKYDGRTCLAIIA